MSEIDGLCSLRLRTPCEWEGAVYQAVGPVQAIPLTSVLSANETQLAEELVAQVLGGAPPLPAPAPDFGVTESPALQAAPGEGLAGSGRQGGRWVQGPGVSGRGTGFGGWTGRAAAGAAMAMPTSPVCRPAGATRRPLHRSHHRRAHGRLHHHRPDRGV